MWNFIKCFVHILMVMMEIIQAMHRIISMIRYRNILLIILCIRSVILDTILPNGVLILTIMIGYVFQVLLSQQLLKMVYFALTAVYLRQAHM
ncbi:MAG: hypothetical protein CVV39_08895 [Planctomycetes bacterium HGW-Planctomycetes-1]|nr:MAG: hypothetical protein CVV39_08895 [Planctomycetes bacterium HGW-Planctomycetes-1]